MILVIDNYDSFTYNLVQYIGSLGVDILVRRNDEIQIGEIEKLNPQKIVISPGPGYPREAGLSLEIIANFYTKIPILGVCLGHQCIAESMAGKIVTAIQLVHGKSSAIYHDGKTIFRNIENPFYAGRYHSLAVDRPSLPNALQVSAETDDGQVMAIRHKQYPVEGVQFHPESILTKDGMRIIKNFLRP